MWRLLGGLLLGALAIGATAYVVKGIIDKKKAREEMAKANMKAAIVKMAKNDTVKLEDLFSDNEIEITGDGISSEIQVGDVIYA